MKTLLLIVLLSAIVSIPAIAAQTYTYPDLVDQMVDMEALAVLPQDGETCTQHSSYDRASMYDNTTGKYVAWEANGDNNGMIRTEGDQFVMAEMKGPGCIRRIWSAAPGKGRVKIYLDDSSEPAVDLPFINYFDHSSKPFVYPSLVHTVSRGYNCYVSHPIPEVMQDSGRKGLGSLLPFHLLNLPPRDTGYDIQAGPFS